VPYTHTVRPGGMEPCRPMPPEKSFDELRRPLPPPTMLRNLARPMSPRKQPRGNSSLSAPASSRKKRPTPRLYPPPPPRPAEERAGNAGKLPHHPSSPPRPAKGSAGVTDLHVRRQLLCALSKGLATDEIQLQASP
jgi:hypothetical protein